MPWQYTGKDKAILMKLVARLKNKVTGQLLKSISIKDLLKHKSHHAKLAFHKPIVYVAAMPKSAGTFICKTIADIHQLPYLHFSDRRGCSEFDIYHPSLLRYIKEGGIVHQHTLGTEGNIYYLNSYSIPCVVLTRNIYDALYSFYEHLNKYKNVWPMFEYPEGYFRMQEEEKLSFLVTTVAPWLLQFYVSWHRAQKEKKINVLWITYESFMENKISTINSIEALLNIPVEQQVKVVPVTKTNEALRLNKGVSGRGIALMADKHQERIEQIMAFYPEVDFGLISKRASG
jgi:Sulfotransferase domain